MLLAKTFLQGMSLHSVGNEDKACRDGKTYLLRGGMGRRLSPRITLVHC